ESMGRRGAVQRTEPFPFPDHLRGLTEELGDGKVTFSCAQSDMTIHVNPMAVELLLSNFISNALRYGKDSPVTVTARHAADLLTIEVCDRGPGIGSEFLKRVGAPFLREDPARRFETGAWASGSISASVSPRGRRAPRDREPARRRPVRPRHPALRRDADEGARGADARRLCAIRAGNSRLSAQGTIQSQAAGG
ncbi:sensor histidine kinase, partial [Pantanalinema rosaneae CENA516]|uniref:sensor histidine kinase n=1 Tax=Pantanalinema rosaneae TaxID=1620701 RepID=UPI003D6EED20